MFLNPLKDFEEHTVKDTAALEELLVKKIKTAKDITRTSTTIILNTYKEEVNIKNF